MSAHLTQDQIQRLAEDLVYQVGYAFYDVPYIILLNLMVQLEVARESDLVTATFIQATEIRKYMGMLLTHRLIKRHANKERMPIPEFQQRRGDIERTRLREVIYYYIDYREFANVVKYRIAMMRKGIDEKVMQDVGHRGYICPTCSRHYSALQIPNLFSPAFNAFLCEDDKSELIEFIPDETDSSDKMQRFNRATQPIRDALRAVEGVTLPTRNIMAWIAENVKSSVLTEEEGGEGGAKGDGKVQVVLGGEEERERIEKERLAEQQRTQNALPVWHTHSTVTGSATTLGLADEQRATKLAQNRAGGARPGQAEGEDSMLMLHYEGMDADYSEDDEDVREVKVERGVNGVQNGAKSEESKVAVKVEVKMEPEAENEDGEAYLNGSDPIEAITNQGNVIEAKSSAPQDRTSKTGAAAAVITTKQMIPVNGVLKALDEITEEDQEEMTPDEYQAYYEAALA